MPAPRTLSGGPGIAVEWRLVRVAGTIVDVHKLGDRWRAELRVGSARVAISGLPGARIPSATLVEGRRATIVGIARRPYPGAADRRFAVVPRSSADVAVSSAGSSGGNGATSRGNGTATGAGAPGRERATGPDDDGPLSAPTAELGGLDALVGQRVPGRWSRRPAHG